MKSARAFLALIVLSLAVAAVGCPCQGVVNDSPDLRWWLFSNFGASKICPEMLKRGIPLKLPQTGAASIGRFFPAQCSVAVDDNRQVITMSTGGTGYVFLSFTRRIGFSVTMGIEYAPDFRLEDDDIYVWGKFNRFTVQPNMQILGVENPIVSLATQTPLGNVATLIGNGLVASQIGQGFTVVREEDGDDFTIGHLDPPNKPSRQFKPGKDHQVLASDLTSISASERDYLGPFAVEEDNVSLFFHATVTGQAALTYNVAERSVGEAWRNQYTSAGPLAPPPGNLIQRGPLSADTKLAFAVPQGIYYIVIENATPLPLVGDVASQVSYSVEIGDRN